MKNQPFVIAIILVLFVTIAGCVPGSILQINTPVPNQAAGTPAPGGQIDVPGIKIQIYAPGTNPLANTPDSNNRVATFFQGIWHGIISPVTLVLSFINPKIQMYEVHNNGGMYNLGFLIGVAIVFLFLGITAGRRRR
jgi:hypothetical protein